MCDFADIPHVVGNFQHGGKSPHKTLNLCENFLSSRQICDEEWLLMTMAACVEAKAIRRELCRNCVPAGKKLESHIVVTLSLYQVVPPGIEPGTQGFSVLCSTN